MASRSNSSQPKVPRMARVGVDGHQRLFLRLFFFPFCPGHPWSISHVEVLIFLLAQCCLAPPKCPLTILQSLSPGPIVCVPLCWKASEKHREVGWKEVWRKFIYLPPPLRTPTSPSEKASFPRGKTCSEKWSEEKLWYGKMERNLYTYIRDAGLLLNELWFMLPPKCEFIQREKCR